MKPQQHLFRVMKQEHTRDEAEKKKELRAEILFSRLLEGMRGLLVSDSPMQRREIPPFMAIKRTYVRPLRTQVALSSLMRRQMQNKVEVQLHQHTLLAAFFDALDAEAVEEIQAFSLLHFLHNFGLDIDTNAFNCMLEVYVDTTLEGVLTKESWMELMKSDRRDRILAHSSEFQSTAVPPMELGSQRGSLLREIELEVLKCNRLFLRSKLWWAQLNGLHRGSLSTQAACVALSSQYNLDLREVLQRVERLFGKDQLVTEQRFLAILYPNLLFDSLRRLGERMYLSWTKDESQSFPTFVAALNRKAALELLVRK